MCCSPILSNSLCLWLCSPFLSVCDSSPPHLTPENKLPVAAPNVDRDTRTQITVTPAFPAISSAYTYTYSTCTVQVRTQRCAQLWVTLEGWWTAKYCSNLLLCVIQWNLLIPVGEGRKAPEAVHQNSSYARSHRGCDSGDSSPHYLQVCEKIVNTFMPYVFIAEILVLNCPVLCLVFLYNHVDSHKLWQAPVSFPDH